MTAFEAIRTALEPFGFPCTPTLYEGKEDKYFQYEYTLVSGGDFGDDKPECNVASVRVNLYYPMEEDFLQTMLDVQHALHNAGFTWPSAKPMVDYSMTEAELEGARKPLDGVRRIIFECEYTEEV